MLHHHQIPTIVTFGENKLFQSKKAKIVGLFLLLSSPKYPRILEIYFIVAISSGAMIIILCSKHRDGDSTPLWRISFL
jgi:hypothetical protein